jgi:hypothetical protein
MIHLPKLDKDDPYMVAQRKAITERFGDVGKQKDKERQKKIKIAICIVVWLIVTYIVYRLLAIPFHPFFAKALVVIAWMVFGPLYLRAKWLIG